MRILLFALLFAACAAHSPPSTLTADEESAPSAERGAVDGIVLNASDGLPLAMVFVQAEVDGKIIADDMSDFRGHYRLGPLTPGRYKVTARFANSRIEYEGIMVRRTELTNVGIRIDLRDHQDGSTVTTTDGTLGAIEGVVVDRFDGAAFPGTVVSLQAEHLRDVPLVLSDEEGRFKFPGLKPGIYNLSCFYNLVKQGNVEIQRGNIKVNAGETTSVEVKLDLRIRYDD